MHATEYGGATRREAIYKEISESPPSHEGRLPTLDKNIDRYFDLHMEGIIQEWGLITTHDLAVFERRLEDVSREIEKIDEEKSRMEQRAAAIDAALKEMEGS